MWDDPDEFRPERFLNESGEVINADKIIPFGYGKTIPKTTAFKRINLLAEIRIANPKYFVILHRQAELLRRVGSPHNPFYIFCIPNAKVYL